MFLWTKKQGSILMSIVMALSFLSAMPVSADTADIPGYCFCSDDVSQINLTNYKDQSFLDNITHNNCTVQVTPDKCTTDIQKAIGGRRWSSCVFLANGQLCSESVDQWKNSYANQLKTVTDADTGVHAGGTGGSQFIPNCALQDDLPPECRDVSIFIVLAINVVNYLFSFIGALALLVFIYGGFLMILSQGNSEQVQKGKDAMLAAVIGLTVAFSGYVLVHYLGTVVGLNSNFSLL